MRRAGQAVTVLCILALVVALCGCGGSGGPGGPADSVAKKPVPPDPPPEPTDACIAFNQDDIIYTMDENGQGLTALTGRRDSSIAPCWRTLGGEKKIVFLSDRTSPEGEYQIWQMDADGGNVQQLTNEANCKHEFVACSLDGTRIAMVRNYFYEAGTDGLYVWNCDPGTDPEFLTKNWVNLGCKPSWSPDGSYLTYATQCGGQQRIHILPSSGGPYVLDALGLGHDPEDPNIPVSPGCYMIAEDAVTPDWSPVGNIIAFRRQSEDDIFAITVSRSGDDWVPGAEFPITTDGSSPASNGMPSWSPNASAIAFQRYVDGKKPAWWIATINADGSNLTLLEKGGNPDWLAD